MADTTWQLAGFAARLDQWIELESPGDDLRRIVTAWTLTRFEDPFLDANREPGFANLWAARVPGSIHAGPAIVLCAYWVHVTERLVVCESFGSLNYPL